MATMLFHIGNAGVIVAVLTCQAGKTERLQVVSCNHFVADLSKLLLCSFYCSDSLWMEKPVNTAAV